VIAKTRGIMLNRMTLALACAIVAAGAAYADTDTKPVLTGLKECDPPRVPEGGQVKLAFKVTETGAVVDVKIAVSSGDAGSDERAAKCVAKYIYTPATHNGVAVAAFTTFDYHWGRLADMTGERKAFARLERDADRRCQRLYPIDKHFDLTGQPITLVAVARLPSGEVQTKIVQSAGSKADANATKCVVHLIADHEDLPAVFTRTISVDWSHMVR
jgi:TonB family protein